MKSTTHLTLNINRIGERFPNEETMIRWISACLNCNTNHAVVEVEKLSPQALIADSLAKINTSFEAVNSLLDASGALESEALQRAVYQLRLEIAQASGDQARVEVAQACLSDLADESAALPASAPGFQQAYDAFDAYYFGRGVMVEDASGWEYMTPGHTWTRKVFVATAAEEGQSPPTTALTFTVQFDPETGLLREAYALDDKGQRWGSMPSQKTAH